MKLVSFCLLTLLALVYAGVTIAETMTYHKWETAVLVQKYTQTKLAYVDRLSGLLDQMVRRMARDSQHDPALVELLKEHHINVVFQPPSLESNAPETDSVPPLNQTPQPSDKPTQAPAATPTH